MPQDLAGFPGTRRKAHSATRAPGHLYWTCVMTVSIGEGGMGYGMYGGCMVRVEMYRSDMG